MLVINPYLALGVYAGVFLISIVFLQVVDWAKILRKEYKTQAIGILLIIVVALVIAATIGTMIILLASLPYGL